MSLFDYIKYSATDITSEEELFKLPKKLIELYWLEQRIYYPYSPLTIDEKCWFLSMYPNLNNINDIEYYQNNFIIALKKYSKFVDSQDKKSNKKKKNFVQ